MDSIKIINSYTQEYFLDGNVVDQITNLKNLNKFIYNKDINSADLDVEVYTELLNNEKIHKMVRSILSLDDYSSYLSGDLFYSLALAYCTLYGIELKTGLENIEENNIENDIDLYINNSKDVDSLKLYLKEVREYKLLNPDETKNLFIRFSQSEGDEKDAIREIIFNHNLRLVISVAKKYVGRGVEFLDLIQEGNLGLLKSIDRYDLNKGFKFSTYSTWWIKQKITHAIADHSRTIKVPVYVHETIGKIKRFQTSYYFKYGEVPTYEQIAEGLQIPLNKVEEFLNVDDTASLDAPIKNEDGDNDASLNDFVPHDEEEEMISNVAIKEIVDTIVHMKLTSREKIVFFERIGFLDGKEKKLSELAADLGVSRERVRQIQEKATIKIIAYFKQKGFKPSDYGFIEEKKPEIKYPFKRRPELSLNFTNHRR